LSRRALSVCVNNGRFHRVKRCLESLSFVGRDQLAHRLKPRVPATDSHTSRISIRMAHQSLQGLASWCAWDTGLSLQLHFAMQRYHGLMGGIHVGIPMFERRPIWVSRSRCSVKGSHAPEHRLCGVPCDLALALAFGTGSIGLSRPQHPSARVACRLRCYRSTGTSGIRIQGIALTKLCVDESRRTAAWRGAEARWLARGSD